MDLEELIVTYERRVKNLKNENSMTKPLDRVIVAKLLAARKTLNELKLLNIPLVIKCDCGNTLEKPISLTEYECVNCGKDC